MQASVALDEERQASRRTVADALEVVHQTLGLNEIAPDEIRIVPLQLPSGECATVVLVVFADLGCHVSLPPAARFRALSGTSSQPEIFEISALDHADSDGSVLLVDGTRLRAVEVIPTRMPYELSKLEQQILQRVITLTESYDCYRSLREGLPEHFQHMVPDLHALDYSRVRMIQAPPLKVIRAFIEDHDPELKVSNQKIADALAKCGVRVPRRRPRSVSQRAAARATI
jgi:hypothetical protein